jgi:peptide deformylase
MAAKKTTKTVILQDGAPILREVAKPVPAEMFDTPILAKMLADMASALDAEEDGVAIAAPQIGLSYRIFLARIDRTLDAPKEGEPRHPVEVVTFINPEIVKTSRRTHLVDEGCLSCRGFYGKTLRHERVTVRAQDEHGKKFTRGGGDVLAQIFEHEIDHLNGILFVDHAEQLIHVVHGEVKEESPTDDSNE